MTLALLLALAAPPPGAVCTPADPDFDGWRYPARVAHCRRRVSAGLRRRIMRIYHADRVGCVEVDHLIPLALGGSNDLGNLWCQTGPEAHRKDVLEVRLYRQLRRGAITQAEAVMTIRRATGQTR